MASDDFPRSRAWHAQWIWAPGPGQEPNSYWCFRREFSLQEPPAAARLFITADTRYKLWVNGQLAGRGTPQSQPYFQYYDERDVADLLTAGANCIAIVVNYVGNVPDTRGGLLAELVDDQGETVVATSPDWRVVRAAAWRANTFFCGMNKVTPYQEFFDARQMPDGWTEAGFDDDGWANAVALSGTRAEATNRAMPWSRLVPRDIPFLDEVPLLPDAVVRVEECLSIANRMRSNDLSICLSAPGQPVERSLVEDAEALCREDGVTIVQCSTDHLDRVSDGIYDPCIVLDFGRCVPAWIELDLDGTAGGMVDVGYAERLIDGRFNNAIEGQFADRYTMTAGPQRWQTFAWKGFRYVKLRFWSCFEPVRLRSIRAVVARYPFEERGRFASSDERLNAVWDICRTTLRLCSVESIMDTPWREQGQWLGDVSAVTLGGLYACFGETRLPAKFLRQSAANQQPTGLISNITNVVSHSWRTVIPDFSLWWVMGLWNHHLYTGEARWVHAFWPHAQKVLAAFLDHLDAHGLVADMPHWVFIDWADVDKRGECTALNAILYGALEAAVKMAERKGDAWAAERYGSVRAGIRASFVARLFDEARGVFADANVADELSPKASEHASMAAIRFGLCDDALAARILDALYESRTVEVTECQPFFTTQVLQALDRVGRFDLALRIIEERWGRRMLDRGARSTFEEWYQNGSWRSGQFAGFLRTHSHAWSGHPAEFLIRNLIGLEILEPGCRKVRLSPKPAPFDYAVAYPTPLGDIEVTKRGDGIDVVKPGNMELEEDPA